MSETRQRARPGFKDYAAVYGLFAVILVLAYAVFWIWRQALTVALQVFLPQNFGNRSTVLFTMLFFALGLFVAVLSAEVYLRKGIEGRRRQLGRRFLRMAVPLAGLALLGLLLRTFALSFIG